MNQAVFNPEGQSSWAGQFHLWPCYKGLTTGNLDLTQELLPLGVIDISQGTGELSPAFAIMAVYGKLNLVVRGEKTSMAGAEEAHSILRRTLELLEWPELCRRLSGFALSSLGKDLCLNLLPEDCHETIRQQLGMTSEMVVLLVQEGRIPLDAFEDLHPNVEEAERGTQLSGEALRRVWRFLDLVRKVRGFLEKRSESCPSLWDLAFVLQDEAALREALDRAIDDEGQLRESASPRLGGLRREARRCREAIERRLDAFVKDRDSLRILQDSYFTVRNGRYVLPVRADARGALEGIVHDLSSSGATHFMEPSWLVEMNNALRVAELEVQKEVERILDELTRQVATSAPAIRTNLDLMARLDLIHSKAKLSTAIQGSEPVSSSPGELVFRGLRHPLLALRKISVIPNDLFLDPEDRILVVSGPNAGGKTVLLKALGLAVLMERAGLHVPTNPGSRFPPFDKVLADIGDQQDLQQDISTFSGHMHNLREILDVADEDSLVILDELAGSTDPQEGAALAMAVLESLLEQGARALVTTHYPALKAWAQGRRGVRNGAMAFDWERLEPTYQLHLGTPGQSSALEIARRMELPEEVLEKAKSHLKGEETDLEALLRELEQQRKALRDERHRASILRARLETSVAEQEETVRSLRDEREAFIREKRRRLSSEICEARQRIREAIKELSKAKGHGDVERPRRDIQEVEETLRPPPIVPSQPLRPLGEVRPGDPVEVLALGQRGILLDDPSKVRGKLRVKVASMEVLVDEAGLGGVEPTDGESKEIIRSPSAIQGPPPKAVPSEIDLRGMRVEDAISAVERYLDQALLGRREEVRIIHGHGTGALKQGLRQWLADCPWVTGYRPGFRYEGGDGATIVTLKRDTSGGANEIGRSSQALRVPP